ncbi:SPOR domain-containing protein [Aestuariirhabdus litorea]|uniref:SPOR domain-containing protein n=1 Tax=Aestuariirhabdus litorea TaxID=2528527 RepID=A0A3P3VLE6_9GAMM|nr:AAA family ATPase [Aestuariirhabdus litorea]RRJ83157.1 hypothetical protein D0544_15085 [Aestuariirhabdus litorea]RWW93313.1 hypothetical protein DZC74_15055 [Endozoicomonadaceae bacterium GTF-13]
MSQDGDLQVDGKLFRQRLEDALQDTGPLREPFFSGAGRAEVLGKLDHLIQFSDLILVVSAPLGGGKSRLYREFIERQDKRTPLIRCDQALTATPQELAALLQGSAGLQELPPAREVSQLLERLQQHLRQPLLMVIDDAQELPQESWQFLLSLVKGAREVGVHIRVVVFADTSVSAMLDLYGEGQPLHELELPLLDRRSLKEYLDTMQSAGRWPELGRLSNAELGAILKRSGGLIGVVEQLLERRNEVRSSGSRRRLGLPKAHMWALVAVVALLVISYLLQGVFEPEKTRVPLEPDVLSSADGATGSASAMPAPANPAADMARQRLLEAARKVMETEAALPEEEPSVTAVETELPEATAPGGESAVPVEETRIAPLAQAVQVPAKPSGVEINGAAGDEPGEQETSLPEPKASAVVSAERESTAPGPGRQWLLAQPATAYSLQMLGSHQREAVESFIARMGSGSNWHLIETRHQNRPWFIALYGSYPTRDAALAALKSMSSTLQAQKPWARALAPLQGE